MTFTDDLDQVSELAASIVDDAGLTHTSVETPDLTSLLDKLAEAGLTDIARESDDSDNLEVLAATIGTQVGLAHAGIFYPTADFDLYPIRLVAGTELDGTLPAGTLLVPWSAIDQGQPIAWATHAEAVLTHRATDVGVEIALITDVRASEPIVSIDGSPAARITTTSAPDWVDASAHASEWIAGVRQATALAVTAAQLSEIVEMTVRYATERTQFGRPVGKFQAVQKLVAESAANAEMVASAAASSLQHLSSGQQLDSAARLEIVAGCLTAFDAIEVVVRNSHQALGAIGTTLEHPLQRYTRGVLQTRRQMDSSEGLLDSLSALVTSDEDTVWEMVAS
ncbi:MULTISPECIES: acyl-CoA dehydrogenase family protein [Brevibacterium]|uniref:Acyl-CoA dehydrogenase n=2 Tax=Brevibacterium TaxID=1696 RepID=A0A1H1PML3_BRESA|nr:acyl-CoA dehydrogenase family protein [Brevibacterium sandarakinum]SDS11959.1 acyl-CoA dehydrogenase [Brevibacterium sandarakinum]